MPRWWRRPTVVSISPIAPARPAPWRRAGASDDGAWEVVRQAFVAADEPLRLGDHHCTIQSLLGDQLAPQDGSGRGAGSGKGRWRHEGMGEAAEPPRGRVERDPETGEIVPKRL